MAIDFKKYIKETYKNAHRIYLDNWETKTQVAENNGKWTDEVHHRVLKELEDLSVVCEDLSSTLEHILELNPDLKTTTE